MKKLILFELILLFLATTFDSDNQPGWVQQTIPIGSRLITDIHFLDTLNGWVVTNNPSGPDSSLILKTTDSGNSWILQYKNYYNFNAVQFINLNTGYAGSQELYKTINGGSNWTPLITAGFDFQDIFFINSETGWISDANFSFGSGLLKTTDGGLNWTQQLNSSYRPRKLFFINKDTGWVGTNDVNGRLFRTINGGINWNLQYTSNFQVEGLFFLNNLKGWLRGGTGNGVMYTTDGGFTWLNAQGNTAAGFDIRFVNDSIGYTGLGSFRIPKSTDGGKTWGYQTSPIQNNMSVYMFINDTIHGWAGGTGLVKTTDGGGPITYIGIKSNSTFATAFELKQNYPNPFNPTTNIEFEIKKNSKVSLKIFDIKGEEVIELIDYDKYRIGIYAVNYKADKDLSSGVYFYQLTAWTEDKKEIFIDTKKMVFLK